MPREKFYNRERVEGDGLPADLTVTWGPGQPLIQVAGAVALDMSGADRLIRALRRGRERAIRERGGIEALLDTIEDVNRRLDRIELALDE